MQPEIVDLIIAWRWPIVSIIVSVLAYFLLPRLQERRLTHKERLKQSEKTSQPSVTNLTASGNNDLDKYKILMTHATLSDEIKWEQIHVFSMFSIGLIASLFVPGRIIWLSALIGIIISFLFILFITRANGWNRYWLEIMRDFAKGHEQKDDFFKHFTYNEAERKFRWFERVQTHWLLFIIPVLFLLFWAGVLIWWK